MGLNNEPFISNEEIEQSTINLLAEFKQFYKKPFGPFIPIKELLCEFLKIDYMSDNLIAETHDPTTLAQFLIMDNGQMLIRVEESLWPEDGCDLAKLGRFNFTLAHEVMHLVLHKHVLFDHLEQTPLLFGEKRQIVVCRSSQKDRREYQADKGAGYLLMPTEFIFEEWEKKFGKDAGPVNVYEELKQKAELEGKGMKSIRDSVSVEFAEKFRVSPQAMQIRLCDMKLLELEQSQPGLF